MDTVAGAEQRLYQHRGPNPLPPYPPNYHWFQGHGMVHGVRLEGGQARWYRNRWIRSPAVSEALSEPPIPRDAGGWYDGARVGPSQTAGPGPDSSRARSGWWMPRVG